MTMTDDRTTELLSCPFCGGEASFKKCWNFDDESPSGYFVWCHGNDCVVEPMTEDFKEESEAIAAWNTRAELGSGTCEMITSGTACKGNTDKRCTACGAYGIGEHYDGDEHIATPKFCPECGAKVV